MDRISFSLLTENISLEMIKKLIEIYEDLKIQEISQQIMLQAVEDILQEGSFFDETRQEIKDVMKDMDENGEEMDLKLILQVIFFISIFRNCEKIPLVDKDPVEGVIVCFPGGLLNIVFAKRGCIVFEAKSIEAARNADFKYFTLSSNDTRVIERFWISLQRYL